MSQKLIPASEARLSAGFQNQLNRHDENEEFGHLDAAELERVLKERLADNKSFEATRAVMQMCLEKMDQILAIVDAMRQDREEWERRSPEFKKEMARARRKLQRQARRRAQRT